MAAKKSVKLMAREATQAFGYDPLEVLVHTAQDSNSSVITKTEIAMFLMPYVYPKLSSVMLEGEVEITNTSEQQANLMRRILENPELADAAQRLSIAAAEASLENEMDGPRFIQ